MSDLNFDQLKKDYDENGYVVLKGLFSKEDIQKIEKDIEEFIDENVSKLDGRDINYIGETINSIHCIHKFPESMLFKKYVKEPKVFEIAKILLDDDAELRASELFLKPAGKGLQSPMHQDDYYWCVDNHNALTFWIAIDPAGPDNGGVEYIRGSQKLGLVEHENSYAPGSSQTVQNKSLIKEEITDCPKIEPGDALIHHALTIHGSKDNKSNISRRGLTIQIKAASSKYDLERKKAYEEKLYQQIEARNNS